MTDLKYSVLFVCIHNSARSQMAEAFLKQYGSSHFVAESAGLEAGKLNPDVIEVMQEAGIDIGKNRTKSVFDLFARDNKYDAVVTVCDAASAEKCPVFPGKVKRLAWSFSDPSAFTGTHEAILAQTRKVRDEIKDKVLQFISDAQKVTFWL